PRPLLEPPPPSNRPAHRKPARRRLESGVVPPLRPVRRPRASTGPAHTPPRRRVRPSAPRPSDHRRQERDRALLVEGLVAVPAFRRLNARRAAPGAGTQPDRFERRLQQAGTGLVAALGDPGSARIAVVDEDRGPRGVPVKRRGEPADVPPV